MIIARSSRSGDPVQASCEPIHVTCDIGVRIRNEGGDTLALCASCGFHNGDRV